MIKWFTLLLLLSAGCALAQQPCWLRYPSLSPDGSTIVFTYKGNLYKVPAGGGNAIALTSDTNHHVMPVWSRDGRYIAYAGYQHGNADIFIMPAAGGVEKRLTFHSADEFPYGFSEDNRQVLFGAARLDAAASRQFPAEAFPELYSVPAEGGRVTQMLTVPAENARVSRNGRYIIYHDKKNREDPWRKHQVSAAARDIWMYNRQSGDYTQLTAFRGEDRDPVFAAGDSTVYYLSEESGSFNVYCLQLADTARRQQVTAFKRHPVRFLSIADDNTLCFGYNGDIYIKPLNAAPVKVRITIPRKGNEQDEQTVPVTGNGKYMVVAPSGREAAFAFRGEIFLCNLENNSLRRITYTPGEEADLSFSPDGRSLLYAYENEGRWEVRETNLTGNMKTRTLISNDRTNYQPLYSPDGKEIAYIEDRTALKVYNIASGKSRTILPAGQLFSRRDHDQYFRWSPDGKWLLLQYREQGVDNQEAGIIAADGKGSLVNLTENGFDDEQPAWAMNGQAVTWSSSRNGLRSYSSSGSRQRDIYVLFLQRRAWNNFRMDTITRRAGAGIDWQGLQARMARLTPASAMTGDALLSDDGRTLYYLTSSGKTYSLLMTNVPAGSTKTCLTMETENCGLQWDAAHKRLFLLADTCVLQADLAGNVLHATPLKGTMRIDLAAERRSMFLHVWSRTKETFYTAGYHGADWEGYRKDYERFLPHIGNNYEFAEMLAEMLGELNVSHSGASFNGKIPGRDVTASLGACYNASYHGEGVQIAEIIRNGPLDNDDLRPGMIIEAIDGARITADKDLAQYLNRKAGKEVMLTMQDGRNVRVKPVSPDEESRLLYERWVARNREEVEKKSNGRLGYVHLYRMNDNAFREAFGEIMGRYAHCAGVIVDTRFNRGGDLASDLEAFLGGKEILRNTTDTQLVGIEPGYRWTRPSLVLANEANYSDGHCFAFGYQYLGLGKLVGMPVPGSCTFMTGETLQDNSTHWSVPSLGVQSMEGRYLENQETAPDIRVMNQAGELDKGRDQQLEAAIQQLMELCLTRRITALTGKN